MLHELLDATQCAQGLGLKLTCSHFSNLSTQLKYIAPKAYVSQREVGDRSNGCWNAAQMVGNKNPPPPKEGENHPFIARYENLLLGCQMIRLVQQTPDLSGGNLNSNGHIIYWTSVVYDQASPINGSGSR
jgi:hypothetical protein